MSTDTTLSDRGAKSTGSGSGNRFVTSILPWVIGAAALTVYLLTLNPWLSINGLGQGNLMQAARLSGWAWQPDFYGPVYWLVTYPLHWLPVALRPLGLNVFSAVCASLVLALLARSIALLPRDRTEDQRLRERSPYSLLSIRSAWLAPTFAVILCGFQLSFWHNATNGASAPPLAASGEMFDLLLFAYVIRCLLEYRIQARDSWLFRAAAVYGAAMTNNWAMIGFFPLFLAALIWIKGLGFFNTRFLTTMFVYGTLGLLFYFVLPFKASAFGSIHAGFWETLKANLVAQKSFVMALPFNKSALLQGLDGNRPIWVLGLPALLPLFFVAIRWPSYFGDPSKLGNALTTIIFHIFHGVLLLLCIWFALDPAKFSAEYLVQNIPLLTFYYLGALSVGYLVGYFLLVFGARPVQARPSPVPAYMPLVNGLVLALLYALLAVVPVILVAKNLPRVEAANGPLLKDFANLVVHDLPAEGAVLLSDDANRLYLEQGALTRAGRAAKFMFVDTLAMSYPDYHRILAERYPGRWHNQMAKDRKTLVEPIEKIAVLEGLAKSNAVYYLHPSFGFFFERFYAEPHGMAYRLKWIPDRALLAPQPDKELVVWNENFWTNLAATTIARASSEAYPSTTGDQPSLLEKVEAKLRLKPAGSASAATVAAFCSRALVSWGVQLQKLGFLPPAAARFQTAIDLNPDNVVAEVNLACNGNLQSGRKSKVQINRSIEDRFGKYRGWEQVMNANGPFDEPTFCFQEALTFFQGRNFRQAGQVFARVTELAPEDLASHLWLCRLYTMAAQPEKSLQIVTEIESKPDLFGLGRTNAPELLAAEASARLANNDLAGARAAVSNATAKYPDDEDILAAATQSFMDAHYYSNALETINKQLTINPDNPLILGMKGYACLQTGDYKEAIDPLTRALAIVTNFNEFRYNALLNRAIAYLKTDQLDRAREDYAGLEREVPADFRIHFGLGEIAYLQKDTNAALRSYRLYLANAPTNTAEASNIVARIKELKRQP